LDRLMDGATEMAGTVEAAEATETARGLSPRDLGIGRLFEDVRDAIVVADAATGRIVLWNPGAEHLFGYSVAEALALSVEVLVPPRLKARHREGMARYHATGHGRIVDAGAAIEVPARRKTGEEITVELSLSPMPDTGRGRYALAIIRDVTERSQLRAAAERRMRELEALYRADEAMHRSLRLDEVLQTLVDVAADILQADKTVVMMWDARRERLVVGAVRGFRPEALGELGRVPGEGVIGQVAVSGEPIGVADARGDPRVPRHMTEAEGIRSMVHVPIVVGGEVFGVFGVNYCRPRPVGSAEQRLLLALAQRAALAIENARLYAQAQQAAVLEERQRLARELHDAVTQTLFSASLIADVLPRLWERSADEGRRRLVELRELTRGALAEMRALLLELRPAALTEAGLGDLLRQLAEATTGRARLPVEVAVDGQRALPADVQIALYRIAQEALNNVAKHAGASQAVVTLRSTPEQVELRIADDGRGFDPAAVPSGHLGVGIMRERAGTIGAVLQIDSHNRQGTQVLVTWRAQSERTHSPTPSPP
jgi:PAS domain S-box-containing protein